MKRNNKIKFLSLIKDIALGTNMISLNSFELLALHRTFGFRVLNAIGMSSGGYTFRLNIMLKFFNYVLFLHKHHGLKFAIAFLKAGQLAIVKKIADNPVKSLREINPEINLPRLANGFPSIIPITDRRLMMRNSSSVIRYWLTLFSLYRILSVPGKIKWSTITDKFSGDDAKLGTYSDLFSVRAKSWVSSICKLPDFRQSDIVFLNKASPTSTESWKGYFADCLEMPESIRSALRDFLASSCQNRILNYLNYNIEMAPILNQFTNLKLNPGWKADFVGSVKSDCNGEVPFGQLKEKLEAAGKVRMFAMVDFWTQISLRGLHNYIFDILKQLPNDGTFDQRSSVLRAGEKARIAGHSFGYDLTAATDRLPLELQIGVLASFFSWDFAYKWADLLVYKRKYYHAARSADGHAILGVSSYEYAVGQPMGALSSWGMLALTHHLIVQLAYKLSYPVKPLKWFDGYELLGDDIVIFDEKVARVYLEIMNDLGVPINLSKSVVAKNNTLEFAKVVLHNGVDVSALSWRQFLADSRSIMGRTMMVDFFLRKGIGLSKFSKYLQGMFRKSKWEVGLMSPGLVGLATMLANKGVFTYHWLLARLNNPKSPLQSWYNFILLNLETTGLGSILYDYYVKAIKEFPLSPKREVLMNKKSPWIMITLMGKLMMMQRKQVPSTHSLETLREDTLRFLLKDWEKIPSHFQRDLFDFFTMAIWTPSISKKIAEWRNINVRSLSTIDELLKAITLFESIESHFKNHLKERVPKKDNEIESPLRILKYITDLTKRVPPFVKERSNSAWFS